MTGENERKGEAEDLFNDPLFQQRNTVRTTQIGNRQAPIQQAGRKRGRPTEDVNDAPTSELAKKARGLNGQAMPPPARRIVPAVPAAARPTTAPPSSGRSVKSGRRDTKLTEFRTSDFLPGYIIWAPSHETSLNPNPDMTNPKIAGSIAQADAAAVSSKSRPAIVLAAYEKNMLVMPLGTRNGKGLSHMPPEIRHEYVAIKESGAKGSTDTGSHGICLLAYMAPGEHLSMSAVARMTHVAKVDFAEDIKIVGALDNYSTNWLIGTWLKLRQDAENKGWDYDDVLVDRGEDRWELGLRRYTRLNNRRA